MLFLITKKQKDKILDEYYSALINIFSLSLIVLIVVFIISFFPTYLTMKVDREILEIKLKPLEAEMEKNREYSKETNSLLINDNISILSIPITDQSANNIYNEIKDIYTSIPNVIPISIDVDILSKKVIVNANIDNKNTASVLVDKLNSTKYKGADLPLSVYSQNDNFIFNQTLSYE